MGTGWRGPGHETRSRGRVWTGRTIPNAGGDVACLADTFIYGWRSGHLLAAVRSLEAAHQTEPLRVEEAGSALLDQGEAATLGLAEPRLLAPALELAMDR